MLEFEFSIWLLNNNYSRKLSSDYISRLKRIERSISDCDIDEEYYKDKCEFLLSLFKKSGKNEKMASRLIGDLPIGQYYISTYKYAIKKYINFMDWFNEKIN